MLEVALRMAKNCDHLYLKWYLSDILAAEESCHRGSKSIQREVVGMSRSDKFSGV